MAHLRLTTGDSAGTRYPLEGAKTVLGRHPNCDIVTDASAVSRYHAQITARTDGLYVEDLNSRNGTFVNEQKVMQPQRLRCDDVVRICDLVFVFHDEVTQGQILSSHRSNQPSVFFEDTAQKSSFQHTLDIGSSPADLSVSADVKLQALVELTNRLATAVGTEEVLPKVLETMFQIFPQADRGFIVFRSPEGQLTPKAAKFRREDDASARISRTIVNYAIDERQAIISADAADDDRFDLTESIAQFQIRSLMCVPLVAEDRVLGALHIDTVDPQRSFGDTDLELLVAIGAQVAMAIHNAELHERALEQRAMQRDLELAQQVQMGLLPQKRPQVDGYCFFDYYRAANHIGGDYFDYIRLPDGRIAIIVADVSGHGAAAALLMTKLRADAKFCLATTETPSDAIRGINKLLCDDGVDDRFVTMVMMVLQPNDAKLSIVNAGHYPPLCARGSELVELAEDIVGLPLGVSDDFEYRQHDVGIETGDVVALYTDGIVEAMNSDGAQYGSDRFRKRIQSVRPSLDEYGAELIDDVRRFAGNQPQSDDICVVCLGYSTNGHS